MRCYTVLFLVFNFSLFSCQKYPLLLLVSFDGFRHDYPQIHGPLKNFQRLAERGVHARNMISTFTTATFPNHYTLVTGLYEEIHGVVSNSIFDPKSNATFDSTKLTSTFNWWPYPAIWNFNEQRQGARSGVSSWPQHSINISRYQPYNRSRSFRETIDQILNWFNDPIESINFGAIYYDEPDLTGHRNGPYSPKMTEKVRECDEHLGYLLDQIDSNKNLRENLHLLVTSDHGMEQINGTRIPIYIEDYIDNDRIRAFGVPPAMNIFVRSSNDIDFAMKTLSKIPHSKVYRREDIPERFHYKKHERIGDILLLFEPGYEIVHDPAHDPKSRNYSLIHGNHGYDNQLDSMKGIFYAFGPKFQRNYTLDNSSFLYNIDLFNLMCIILNINPCPISNGTIEHIKPFLKQTKPFFDRFIFIILMIGLSILVLIGIIWSIYSIRNFCQKKKLPSNMDRNDLYFSKINNLNVTSAIEIEQL